MELSNVLTMESAEATERAKDYREIKAPSDEDKRILAIFTALAAGKQVIDWEQAIRDAGLSEQGLPVLAIRNTVDKWCYLRMSDGRYEAGQHAGYTTAQFSYSTAARSCFEARGLPPMRYVGRQRSQVPIVPPACRVRGWKSMLVLWEVEEWAVAPRPPGDPILLRPLYGTLATVEAEWDLTEVERLVLGQRP